MLNFRTMVFVLASLAAVSSAAGQTTRNTAAVSPQRNVYRRSTLDERVKRFAKALDLDESQQTALKTLLERQQAHATQIRLDTSLAGTDRIGRLRALQQDTVSKIRGLLTEEQKKKYDPQSPQSGSNASGSYVSDWLKTPQR